MTRIVGAALLALSLVTFSAEAKDTLPGNVTTRPYGGGSNQAIDSIDYSFAAGVPVDFSRVKMCVASNITNNAVALSDSAGSSVGAGGAYHQAHNSSTVQGGSVFKYVDDSSKGLVAQGLIQRQGGLGGMLKFAIRFDLEVSVSDANVKMRIIHVEEAMRNTGSAQNDGFRPIGVWAGSMYKKDLEALNAASAELKSCFAG